MENLIIRRAHGFESKVINNQQRDSGQRDDFAFNGTDGPGRGKTGAQQSLCGDELI